MPIFCGKLIVSTKCKFVKRKGWIKCSIKQVQAVQVCVTIILFSMHTLFFGLRFCFCVALVAIQNLFLLCTEKFPPRSVRGTRVEPFVNHEQDKHPTHCTIYPTSYSFMIFSQLFYMSDLVASWRSGFPQGQCFHDHNICSEIMQTFCKQCASPINLHSIGKSRILCLEKSDMVGIRVVMRTDGINKNKCVHSFR